MSNKKEKEKITSLAQTFQTISLHRQTFGTRSLAGGRPWAAAGSAFSHLWINPESAAILGQALSRERQRLTKLTYSTRKHSRNCGRRLSLFQGRCRYCGTLRPLQPITTSVLVDVGAAKGPDARYPDEGNYRIACLV